MNTITTPARDQRRLYFLPAPLPMVVPLLALICAACSPDMADLEALTAGEDAKFAPTTRPANARPAAFAYRSAERRSPFAPPVQGAPPSNPQPRHGPLADVPLAEVRLVGTLAGQGASYGLFQGPNGAVHRLAVGDPLGLNSGYVEGISEAAVQLVETVRDGAGGWRRERRSLSMAGESGNPQPGGIAL